VDRDSGQVTVIADRDDGWYDTGDLAVPDGWDGIRIVGRSADRINRGFMVPAVDVEPALLKHPGVAEVALVGVQVEHDTLDQAVAVIVPTAGATPTLGELREFLTAQGMTDWYLPTHVLIVDALPRNTTGKILKERLRRDPRIKATVRLLPRK
jgi:cyclohexanecarboxylate-CoA ligase